jgi:FKBP-type peptidyl-prolyl cis-trans isomerase (trigger factor)
LKEFEIEVSASVLEQAKLQTLRKIAAQAELPGFRKGKAPEALVLKETGEMHVLQEAAEQIVNTIALSLLTEKKLKFIGSPSITLTALAPGNPLRFKVVITVAPEISLPDYKQLARDVNKREQKAPEVTEKELGEALEHIQKLLVSKEMAPGSPDQKTFELNDESVKLLGKFESLNEFKEKLKQDMLKDKEIRAREKVRLEIVEAIVAHTKTEVPDMLVEHEVDAIESEFVHDVERMGQKMDTYLTKIKKTREDLRKEWRPNAQKRALFELVLPHIAKAEQVSIPSEEIEHETKHLLEHYKDADKESARFYVERSLIRQKVLQLLESQK